MLRLGSLAAFLPLLAVSTCGCSYTSDYRPPNDGRARPLWIDDEVVVSRPTSLPQCAPPPQAYYQGWVPFAEGYWDPPEERGGGAVIAIVGGPPLPLPVSAGGGSGGGGDSLEGLAVVMAAAIVAFPFVALGLALGQPEPEEEVATAIDAVNTYNDRARYRIAECMAYHQRLRGGR